LTSTKIYNVLYNLFLILYFSKLRVIAKSTSGW
jgi:hypothetical protein